MQNVAEGQETDESPPDLSTWVGGDHDVPFQLKALPFASTAMQNVAEGHSIDVSPPPEGSIGDGDVHVGASDSLNARRVCKLIVPGAAADRAVMSVPANTTQIVRVTIAIICILRICPHILLAAISRRSASTSSIL